MDFTISFITGIATGLIVVFIVVYTTIPVNDSKLKKIAKVLLTLAFFLVNYFLHLP
jgi:NhaP-type Na+/H+ or K+/H+ antiporter